MSWYDGVNVNQKNFSRMARSFVAIQLPVFSSNLTLRSGKIEPFAYADQKNGCIVVRNSMLDGTDNLYGSLDWRTRLEMFNAIIIHEAAHFKLSPPYISGFTLPGRKLTENVVTILQIVEDLYIENYVGSFIRYLEPFLINFNSLIFPNEEIEKRRNDTTGEAPLTLEEGSLIVHYAYSFKRTSYVFSFRSEWERKLHEMFISVFGMSDVKERAKLAYRIYDYIFNPEQQDEEEEKGNDEGEGEGNSSGLGDKESDASEAPGDKEVDSNSIVSSMSPNGKTVIVKLPDYTSEEVDNRERRPVEFVAVSEHDEIFVERVVGGENVGDVRFTPMDFNALRVVENARGSVRSVVGAPSYSGKRMTHLHRAGMDGKIFGNITLDGQRAGKGAPEIVFLLDLSGSMNGSVGAWGSNKGSKADFAMSAAVAINNALSATKTKFCIIGHTTTTRGGKYGVRIVEFKKFGEIVGEDELKNRMRRIKGTVQFAGNADGAALLIASDEFSKSHMGDKILFIVSDGAPAEDFKKFYVERGVNSSDIDDDYYSIVHNVAAVANHIRSKGVKLFSASIDESAVDSCNQIYGEKNNVKVDEVSQLVSMVMSALN